MTNDTLASLGASLGNVAANIAALSGQDDIKPSDAFEVCLAQEVVRLRTLGQDQLAEAVGTIRNPLARFLSHGW